MKLFATGDTLAVKKKIVLLGNSAVGKTSLIRRYVFDQFDDNYIATIGSKVTKKELVLHQSKKRVNLSLMIWDLIGKEGYHSLHAKTIVGVHGAFLVVDFTRKDTLQSLEKYWIPFIFRVVGPVPLVFASNKSDLKEEFQFDFDDLLNISSKYNQDFILGLPDGLESSYASSAKTGENVEKAFESLGHMLMVKKEESEPVKELYESLIATGIQRSTDKTTPIGALDTIIIDFCRGFEDSRMAMIVLRQELARAEIDISDPTKDSILKAVGYLAEAENEFNKNDVVNANLERRMKWAKSIREEE
jgi:small GTP-binding protein